LNILTPSHQPNGYWWWKAEAADNSEFSMLYGDADETLLRCDDSMWEKEKEKRNKAPEVESKTYLVDFHWTSS